MNKLFQVYLICSILAIGISCLTAPVLEDLILSVDPDFRISSWKIALKCCIPVYHFVFILGGFLLTINEERKNHYRELLKEVIEKRNKN